MLVGGKPASTMVDSVKAIQLGYSQCSCKLDYYVSILGDELLDPSHSYIFNVRHVAAFLGLKTGSTASLLDNVIDLKTKIEQAMDPAGFLNVWLNEIKTFCNLVQPRHLHMTVMDLLVEANRIMGYPGLCAECFPGQDGIIPCTKQLHRCIRKTSNTLRLVCEHLKIAEGTVHDKIRQAALALGMHFTCEQFDMPAQVDAFVLSLYK